MEATQSAAEIVKQTVYLKDASIIGFLAIEALAINILLMLYGFWSLFRNLKRK